ncbi:RsiV family protein [Mycolicibacter sp. MYC123]|uniref:RsiV family protein n=2 Tax=[Mycobacterium] zoologicum TaxID=2872311 RepID=A0ABU5YQ10_9MYCO|nr:RsiV family protein [Mycolicibacter sp. MYC123]
MSGRSSRAEIPAAAVRSAAILVLLALSGTVLAGVTRADPTAAVISGSSPDGLGTWAVHYQRLGTDDATAGIINDHIDAEANREVTQAVWDGSTRRPWTFDAAGTVSIRATTVSEVFVGSYNTAEPHMPMQSVGSVVCDAGSGDIITWDNLFGDKTAGLIRLGEQVEVQVSKVVSPTQLRDWRRAGQFAPVDVNFKHWIPTDQGIEFHFPPGQFGPGVKIVTVPWSAIHDQIVPRYLSITEG